MRELHFIDQAYACSGTPRRTLLSRLRQRLAEWVAKLGEASAEDPTARFTSRDWADLPVYHPERDE